MKRKKLNGIKNGLQVVSKTLRFFYNSNSCNNDILDGFTRLKQSKRQSKFPIIYKVKRHSKTEHNQQSYADKFKG